MNRDHITMGNFTMDSLDLLIRNAAAFGDIGSRIAFLSAHLIGTEYAEATLVGSSDVPEAFVINLQGVDCFTFLEYVEAMRRSGSFSEFSRNLRSVRYRDGIVDFSRRNHFFTDWKESNAGHISDVTENVGSSAVRKVAKTLNEREDGTLFLPGIMPVQRDIRYIPSESIDDAVKASLRTGDYAGIYTDLKGLDVSHVGIVIREGETLRLRHASSQKQMKKVVDQDFSSYMSDKPGILVFRPVMNSA